MDNKTIAIASIVFVVVVAGLFGYTYLERQQITVLDPVAQEPDSGANNTNPYFSNLDRIDAKHYFIDGVHTLVGELTMPTPCDLLEHEVLVAESLPEQVTINFTVLNNSDNCVQVVTTQRFIVEVSVDEAATFNATLAGRPVTLNRIPAPEGETPEEFELFIKG